MNKNNIKTLGHLGVGGQKGYVYHENYISPCVPASTWKDPIKVVNREKVMDTNKIIRLGNIISTGSWDNPQRGNIYSKDGVSPTLNGLGGGGNNEPKILIKEKSDDVIRSDGRKYVKVDNTWYEIYDNGKEIEIYEYRIRKLTPLECWRLMGFSDEDFNKAKSVGTSNTQLYKQAGNSIVVNVLYHIFGNLYDAMPYLFDDLKVGSFFSGIGAFEKALDRIFESKEGVPNE